MSTRERELVLSVLTRIRSDGTFSHVAVRETLEGAEDLSQKERAFVKRLAEGVTERREELDSIINAHLKKKGRIKPVLRDILRMGVYQLLYMDSVPDSAVCNEAVNMTKQVGRTEQAGFVNGILRAIARENAAGSLKTAEEQSLRSFMPAWIVRMWEEQLGPETAQTVLRALMEIRPVSIRVDDRCTPQKRSEVLRQMEETGIRISPGKYLPYAFLLEKVPDLRTVPGFMQGLWTVQDESSMLVAEAAGLSGTETVMDVCAAPGGKTLHFASRLEALAAASGRTGRVLAFDKSADKVAKIKENVRRMRLHNVTAAVRDARRFVPEDEGKADVVLCDVPCSGLGVTGKKRDIKYRVTQKQIEDLIPLQREIAAAASKYVRKGGIFLYSTCTINQRENEEAAAYIRDELGLVPDALAPHLPENVSGIRGNMLQLLPGVHGTDGFFIARFRRED